MSRLDYRYTLYASIFRTKRLIKYHTLRYICETLPMERLRLGDPEEIGPWQIVNRLGSGGMGIVYMGTNGTHAAAIKVVRDFLLEDPTSRTRLAREVETLQRVRSPHVAQIVGSDVKGNPAWIATNYVDGPSLKVLIEKEGALSRDDWMIFAHAFLSALKAVHSVGVVHRDIKPSNILMSNDGPKLIDFGISLTSDVTSLTRTGMVAGTPAWLAPEQFLGGEITTAVDNFAAGSTLMYAATGQTPWGADDSSVAAVMHTILSSEMDLSSIDNIQAEIIGPLVEKDPKVRTTAAQSLKQLNEFSIMRKAVTQKITETFTPAQAEEKAKSQKTKRVVVPKTKSTASKSKISSKQKQLGAAVLSGVVLIGGVYFATTNKSKTPLPATTTAVATISYTWSALVSGESEPQSGNGTTFSVFICEQGVITSSLKASVVTANTNGSKTPTAKVISNDKRCGTGFDTIVISGEEAKKVGSSDYYVAGKTKTGYAFRYDFTLSIETKT